MLKSTQFTAMNAQFSNMIDTSVSLMNASIEGFKQAAFVQCEAARAMILESANAVKAMSSVTSPAEMANCMKQFAANSMECGIAKSKELFDVMNTSKTVYSDAATSTIKGAQETLVKTVDQMSAVNPAFSKVASESIQSMISTSNQAADTVAKVSAQVAEVATKNMEAATQATLNTVKKATAAK